MRVGLFNTKLDKVIQHHNRCQAILYMIADLIFVNRHEFYPKFIKFYKKKQLKLKIIHLFVRYSRKIRI